MLLLFPYNRMHIPPVKDSLRNVVVYVWKLITVVAEVIIIIITVIIIIIIVLSFIITIIIIIIIIIIITHRQKRAAWLIVTCKNFITLLEHRHHLTNIAALPH